jgi:hypothetical protein
MTPTTAHEPSGSWDSIHVFETAERGRQAHYKLTSTVMLQLVTRRGSEGDGEAEQKHDLSGKKGVDGWKREGEVSLSGSMTRQASFFSLPRFPPTDHYWPLDHLTPFFHTRPEHLVLTYVYPCP